MYISKAEIQHVRNIDNNAYTFKPGINVIIGDNGVGKTAILEALAIALGGFISGVPDVSARNFHRDEFTKITEYMGDGSYSFSYPYSVSVSVTINLSGLENNDFKKQYTWTRYRKTINDSKTRTTPQEIDKVAFSLYNNPNATLPIILFQSASRPWKQAKNKKQNVFAKKYSRSVGYTDCLQDISNIKFITNWCEKMEMVSFQRKKVIREYESAKNALHTFLKLLVGIDGSISYDSMENEIVYDDGKQILPVRVLSSGYQSLVDLVMEIACRMSMLNPHLLYNAYQETPGVVLIDEIDLHLHPKWQWQVLNVLHEVFPRVQFIVTTHSPIIISSADDINIIALNQDGSQKNVDQSISGWKVSDVLEDIMGSSERNPQYQKLLDEFTQITKKRINNSATEKDIGRYREIVNILNSKLPEDDSSIETARFFAIEEEIKKGN